MQLPDTVLDLITSFLVPGPLLKVVPHTHYLKYKRVMESLFNETYRLVCCRRCSRPVQMEKKIIGNMYYEIYELSDSKHCGFCGKYFGPTFDDWAYFYEHGDYDAQIALC